QCLSAAICGKTSLLSILIKNSANSPQDNKLPKRNKKRKLAAGKTIDSPPLKKRKIDATPHQIPIKKKKKPKIENQTIGF
ncbi:MAG: hypothetical protein KJ687_05820, partial [Proteobacteria bacterium]|nr:hypothetical protein [Pseudomonadota bacterium]